MSNFLELLPLDLSRIEEFIEPREEPEEFDEIVGPMTDIEKKVYTKIETLNRDIMVHLSREMIPHLIKLIDVSGEDKEEAKEVLEKAIESYSLGNEVRAKINVLSELLEILIKDRLSIWDPSWEIGYRKGFQIAKYRLI
jgi:ferritin